MAGTTLLCERRAGSREHRAESGDVESGEELNLVNFLDQI